MFAPGKTIEKWVPKEIWQNAHPSHLLGKPVGDIQWLTTLAQSFLHPKVAMTFSSTVPAATKEYAERRCRDMGCLYWWRGHTLTFCNPKTDLTVPLEVQEFLEDFVRLCFRCVKPQ